MSEEKELSAHLQDSIAYLAVLSTPFLKLVRNFIKPELMPSETLYWVIKACYKYFDIAKEAPQDHICDALNDVLRGVSGTKKELVFHFLDRISQMRTPNSDYVINKLNSFVKSREFETGAVEFVKLVDQKRFLEAELLMYNVLRTGVEQVNIGCDYFKDFSTMLNSEVADNLTSMGLEYFDCYQTFKRGQLGVVLAGYKGGKSWSLHHIGKEALLRGLNVLHVSHENSAELCERRYDRIIGSLAKHDIANNDILIRVFNKNSGRVENIKVRRSSEFDIAARKEARKTIQRYGGRLIIRKFPMGSCDMRDLERYLDYLERFAGFVPDVLLNDYADIQKPLSPEKATRDQLNESYIYHKRLADERKMLVVTPSQATREAIRAKRLTMKDFAEDIRKLANCDWAIAVCANDAQASSGMATLYVVAARDGIMDVGCGILQNLDIGQFASCSFPIKLGVSVANEETQTDSNKTI
jgi:hypothetical protein